MGDCLLIPSEVARFRINHPLRQRSQMHFQLAVAGEFSSRKSSALSPAPTPAVVVIVTARACQLFHLAKQFNAWGLIGQLFSRLGRICCVPCRGLNFDGHDFTSSFALVQLTRFTLN